METQTIQGLWGEEEKANRHSINLLELRAVKLALQRFHPTLRRNRVLVKSDNMTMVAYLNSQGGTRTPALPAEAMEIMRWAEQFLLSFRVIHIEEDLNQKAQQAHGQKLSDI